MHVHFAELSLAELLDDPLVQLLMARDGVKDAALCSLIQTIRYARRARQDDNVNHAGKAMNVLRDDPLGGVQFRNKARCFRITY